MLYSDLRLIVEVRALSELLPPASSSYLRPITALELPAIGAAVHSSAAPRSKDCSGHGEKFCYFAALAVENGNVGVIQLHILEEMFLWFKASSCIG